MKVFINDCRKLKNYNKKKLLDNNNPYLSVCIPAYNIDKYLEKALLSIINQSFQDFEIIIVNNNSFDNTGKILKSFEFEEKE